MTTPQAGLIQRLEGLSGPDREIGNEVLLACGWTSWRTMGREVECRVWEAPGGKGITTAFPPDPTASVDAALTLVPDGWRVASFCEMFNEPGLDWMCVLLPRDAAPAENYPSGRHRVPAIALCIAALKARTQGSLSKTQAIYSNEVAKAARAIDALSQSLAERTRDLENVQLRNLALESIRSILGEKLQSSESSLREAVGRARTPGTVEVCSRCNRGVHFGGACHAERCPIKQALTPPPEAATAGRETDHIAQPGDMMGRDGTNDSRLSAPGGE